MTKRFYTDQANIMRSDNYVTSDGETRMQPLLIVYANVPCRISQKALSTNSQTEAVNNIRYETKLFISPKIEIHQGDIISVIRGSSSKIYTAGEPFLYSTHQEVSLQRKERA
ncbi:ABC transporter ATP-binding protein [Lysinibacillus piscis]|uniref:ABC transporter ATP-binding protein n=1 Tax=Lysinibacillus piscis TaxID=2518931 RepID=A0ABQ5NGI7_9BACI|nr:ABC transporter ATP-binding protein [Lysinibacillus sp. KH24]GLC87495.1 hypothetical protein LYSBPC_06220 [Lysinibacillus sp. KH24]